MRDPTSPRVIQVIQEIKNDVERPRCCRWLENLQSDDTKRTRTRRYRDGAVKIMNLLRPELKAGHILTYQRYYERVRDLPESCTGERLDAAKRLWEYVLYLDERLSHERITSMPFETRRTENHRAPRPAFKDPPKRRVRFREPVATSQTSNTQSYQPIAATAQNQPRPQPIYQGSQWWPSNHYAPSWRPAWPPGYQYGSTDARRPPYSRWGHNWHNSQHNRSRVRG